MSEFTSFPVATGTYQAAPRYFSEAVEACLAVFHRLGTDSPEAVYPVSLSRELRQKGLEVSEKRSLDDGGRTRVPVAPPRAGNRNLDGAPFDLVIESTFPIALQGGEESRFHFENRLRRQGFSAGLMVDFGQSDFITEGFRLVRVKAASTLPVISGQN